MTLQWRRFIGLVLASVLTAGAPCVAQAAWEPTKAIEFIVPAGTTPMSARVRFSPERQVVPTGQFTEPLGSARPPRRDGPFVQHPDEGRQCGQIENHGGGG